MIAGIARRSERASPAPTCRAAKPCRAVARAVRGPTAKIGLPRQILREISEKRCRLRARHDHPVAGCERGSGIGGAGLDYRRADGLDAEPAQKPRGTGAILGGAGEEHAHARLRR